MRYVRGDQHGLHNTVEASCVSLIEWPVLGAWVTVNPVFEPHGYA
jgi:hypothetical protein